MYRPKIERGDFIKVGTKFYQVTQIERPSYHMITVTQAAGISARYDLNGAVAGVPSLMPGADRIFYVFAFGINGGVRIQPFYPNAEPRDTASGLSLFLDRYLAPYFHPYQADFAIRWPNFPSLNVIEDNGGVAVTADIWLFFELLWVAEKQPNMIPYGTGADGKKTFHYTELVDWGQNAFTPVSSAL